MQSEQFIESIISTDDSREQYRATVTELAHDVVPHLNAQHATTDDYDRARRMFAPERVIEFRVDWERDDGSIATNLGYRVQHSSAVGPYKGGLRFDASVNRDILQFLALEQTFKNALTGLPMGSAKGGSDFNPKDASEAEIKRFCQAFIAQLAKHIGPNTDVPAGDIGVGGREVGYMIGQYKRMTNQHDGGTLTGKGVSFGGSQGRTEATGYGVVYLAEHVLQDTDETLEGKTAVISGSGNVATHVAEKLMEKGAVVLTLSERDGYIKCGDGLSKDALDTIKKAKQNRQSLSEIVQDLGYTYHDGTPWTETADLYFPCATQNEIQKTDAESIIKNKGMLLCEGANMPSTNGAVELFQQSDVVFVPAKAANAGGVAVSGLEMAQNAAHDSWSTDEVDERLQEIMKQIFETMKQHGVDENDETQIDYAKGANIGGFVKVNDAMKGLGW